MQPQILLVEDDDRARMLLAGVLRSAGYEVTVAANGEIAIALLDQHGFDVVVSDIWMPSVDGIGGRGRSFCLLAIAQLRARSRRSDRARSTTA
jgi:CheY-like chemotaxis protein